MAERRFITSTPRFGFQDSPDWDISNIPNNLTKSSNFENSLLPSSTFNRLKPSSVSSNPNYPSAWTNPSSVYYTAELYNSNAKNSLSNSSSFPNNYYRPSGNQFLQSSMSIVPQSTTIWSSSSSSSSASSFPNNYRHSGSQLSQSSFDTVRSSVQAESSPRNNEGSINIVPESPTIWSSSSSSSGTPSPVRPPVIFPEEFENLFDQFDNDPTFRGILNRHAFVQQHFCKRTYARKPWPLNKKK